MIYLLNLSSDIKYGVLDILRGIAMSIIDIILINFVNNYLKKMSCF